MFLVTFGPKLKEKSSARRPRISAGLRALVWNTYVGEEKGIFRCMCGSVISQLNFECGHIQPWSQGGETSLYNLRPICSRCNRSMGTINLLDYMTNMGLDPLGFFRMGIASGLRSQEKKIETNIETAIIIPSSTPWTVAKTVYSGVSWTLGKTWWLLGKIISLRPRKVRFWA